jgi:hypothetical protein
VTKRGIENELQRDMKRRFFFTKFTLVACRTFVCSGKENLISVVTLQADKSGIEMETAFLWYIK